MTGDETFQALPAIAAPTPEETRAARTHLYAMLSEFREDHRERQRIAALANELDAEEQLHTMAAWTAEQELHGAATSVFTGGDADAAGRRSPFRVKFLIGGGISMGQSTMVRRISGTYLPYTGTLDVDGAGKEFTLQCGRIKLNNGLLVDLFGAPVDGEVLPLWERLIPRTLGAVALVDTRRLQDSFAAINLFEEKDIPFVVTVNRAEGAEPYPADAIKDALELADEVPVIFCDMRTMVSCIEPLKRVLELIMAQQRKAESRSQVIEETVSDPASSMSLEEELALVVMQWGLTLSARLE